MRNSVPRVFWAAALAAALACDADAAKQTVGRKIAEGSYAQVAADRQVQIAYLGTE